MPLPRVLIVHASVGGGHTRAAEAIAEAFALRSACEVVIADYNDLVPRWQRAPIQAAYRFALGNAPALWRTYYRRTDRPAPTLVARLLAAAGVERTAALLDEVAPELVVSTFSGAAALIGAARERGRRGFAHVVVTTDYRPHRHWVRDGVDRWFAATDEARACLVELGAPAHRIDVAGFPVRCSVGATTQAEARAALVKRFELDERPIVVVAAGAQPTRRAPRIAAALGGLQQAAQVLVCFDGPLPASRGALRFVRAGLRDDFPLLLAGADVLVGKSGGATVAEACAIGRAFVIVDPYPGQEEDNAEWLERQGAAIYARRIDDVAPGVDALLASRRWRAHVGNAARRLATPGAAVAIVQRALALVAPVPAVNRPRLIAA